MTAIFFNLLVNAAFSLACGYLVVQFFLWLFRIQTGPLKLFFLSLPFVKLVFDCVRGIPPNSVLLAGLDPFTLPPKHQLLTVGAGFNLWGPSFQVAFAAQDLGGHEYSVSIGDYLVIWLQRTFSAKVPLVLVCAVLTVSVLLLLMRIRAAFCFERRRRLDKRTCRSLSTETLGFRKVDVYVSELFSGTPFTGGIFRPYICIPCDAFCALDESELAAVIAHETAHIRQFDLLGTIFIQVLGDLFWFVPGYRWLSRNIDRLREIAADQWAVNSGAPPVLLAYALIKLKEIPDSKNDGILYSAFFREKSLLKMRVARLLGNDSEKRSRLGWQFPWLRLVVTFWIFTAVMFATLGGNATEQTLVNPGWLDSWLRVLGH